MLCCVRGRAGPEARAELQLARAGLSELPACVALAGRTLERLDASGNCLTGLPRHLFICRELRRLELADNDVAELPAAVAALTQLRHLDLARNSLQALPELKALRNLALLDLSGNPLERLPESVTTLVALKDLFLNDAGLDFLPANFGRLAGLRLLELRDNYLAALPRSLARAKDLARLDIGQNEFRDFPDVVGRFTKLRELWIDCNSLAELSPDIGELVELVHLEASDNVLVELPNEIGDCRALVDLSLSSNRLEVLPPKIGNLIELVSLKLDSNELRLLPESLGDLFCLEELTLSGNFLNELPRTIGRLKRLRLLNVDENLLKAVPPEIGNCSALAVLSLRSNRLTSVPGEIGHLASLKVLNLVRNSLRCLPQALLNCAELVALWLSENQSKPLVPMQAEIDPRTRQRVLTCFLFPQLPTEEFRSGAEGDDRDAEVPVAARHISFVDVKAAVKSAAEKPGQLRRAPTPYPKELRALAKHARNVHKDGDPSLSMQNAVHVKPTKVTPTLQQRFASNHSVSGMRNPEGARYDAGLELRSDSTYDNSYDDPTPYGPNPNRTALSESADSAYGGFVEPKRNSASRDSVEERVNDIIRRSSHDLYGPARKMSDKRVVAPYEGSTVVAEENSPVNGPRARDPRENPYGYVKGNSDDPAAVAYVQAKEKIYGGNPNSREYADYSPTSYGPPSTDQNLYAERLPNNVTAQPNNYNYSTNDESAVCIRPQNYVGDPQYESTNRVYSRDNPSPGYGSYNGQETVRVAVFADLRISQEMPASVSPSKMNPPPYHIAATFSKQAQFFNATN